MFLSFNFHEILKLIHFKILDQFNHSSFKIYKFNFLNKILLDLYNLIFLL